jgi:biopolymer transport protein ExbD
MTTLRTALLVSCVLSSAAFAADPPPAPPAASGGVLLLRLRAAKDGSLRDVELVREVGGGVVAATIDPHGKTLATPVTSWGELLGEALAVYRKQPGFGDRYLVRIAPDAGLKLLHAAAINDTSLALGFQNTEFADAIQVVAVTIAADGEARVDGKAVTPDELKELLAERALSVRSVDKVEVVIYAHPDVKYDVVAKLLRRIKDWRGHYQIRPLKEADQ